MLGNGRRRNSLSKWLNSIARQGHLPNGISAVRKFRFIRMTMKSHAVTALFSHHAPSQRTPPSHEEGMRNQALVTSSGGPMKAVGLKLSEKGFELCLAEIPGQ